MVTRNGGLPEDMMVEILSKLPVKSLIRLKCVCKQWYVLVKDDSFISKHRKTYNEDNTRLVVIYMDPDSCGQKLSLYPDQTLSNLSHYDIDPQIPVLRQIMGPYDGLFCLYGYNQIFLWNPATRETVALPKCRSPILSRAVDPAAYYCNIGFGLDLVNNDYKLVLIRTLWDDETHLFYEFSHVSLYNLHTNSWKDFEVVELTQYSLHKRSDSIYFNGVCYWLAMPIRDNEHQVILSFHMSDEILREIEGPSIPESMSGDFGLYNDSLSLLLLDTVESNFEIWVMEGRCWTKQLTIGPLLGVRQPLGLWKNGAFFIESTIEQLLLYDPNTQELRDLGLKTIAIEVRNYKESLTKIKPDNNLKELWQHYHV